jgi:hypothetical protein
MDIIKPYIDRNTGRKMNDSPYTRHLQEVHPIDIDAGYIVKNNIQNVPMSDELQEDELIDVDSERGQVWAAASRVVHDAMYDGVNALTVKAPESESDFGRFGVEFYGQLEHNFSQMGYNIAKLQGADERTKMALYHLQSEYAKLPMFSWNGAKRFAKGLSTDPTTYAGIGTLGLGFLGRAGVKQTTKQGFKEMLRRGITSPYAIAALEGGSYSGLYDYFTQEIGVEAGVRDNIDPAQIATSTAVGAAAGPAVVAAGEGIVRGAQKAAPVIRDLFDEAGQAADARIANDTGVKLMSGSDPTDAINAALSYAGRKARKSGQLVGAPPEITSQRALNKLRRNLEAATAEGEPGRFWYERSGKAILDALGGNKDDADKLAQAIAITSSATGVKTNFDFALQAFLQHKAGKPIKTGRFPAPMSKRIQKVFDGEDWEGRKTNNFYVNLMREIDPSKVQGVTTDMWMMRAFGFKNPDGTDYSGTPTDAQYTFVEEETKRIAGQLGWEPQQVQAAIWVADKARKEGIDVKEAAFDYSDALLNNKAQISWESIPGRTGNHMPEMFDAPYEVQQEYHVAVSKAFLDENGNDFVAKELGIPTPGDFEAPGYFEGKVSPGTQTELAIPREYGGPKYGSVEPAALELMEAYAAIRGVAMKQDGVGFHRPFYNPKKADANGVELRIGRKFSEGETERLAQILSQLSGHGEYNPIATRDGVRIINFDFAKLNDDGTPSMPDTWLSADQLKTNKEFTKLVQSAIETLDLDDDIGVEVKLFNSQNGYAGNDWSVNKNGEDYLNDIRGEGRSDLQRKVRSILSRLQTRIDEIDTDFSERYGFTRNTELNQEFRGGEVGASDALESVANASEM